MNVYAKGISQVFISIVTRIRVSAYGAQYKEAARVASLTGGTRGVINRFRIIGVNYPWTRC
jgi:hypothetical protein